MQQTKQSPIVPINKQEEQKFAKYKIPKVVTNLESATFSDIVNYESNDDNVSLTGDRRLKRHNYAQLYQNQIVPPSDIPKPPKVEEIDHTELKQHENEGSFKSQESSFPLNKLHRHIKRESDMVNIDESYNISSKYSDNASALYANKTHRSELKATENDESQNDHEIEHLKRNLFLPKDDLYVENKIREPSQMSNNPMSEPEHNYEIIKKPTVLNRISEEAVAQSGETLMNKSLAKEKNLKQNQVSIGKESSESNQFVTFEDPSKFSTAKKSPQSSPKYDENMNKNLTTSKKASPNRNFSESQEQEIMNEVKRREKEKQLRKYEEKLKELERLERILKNKEMSKKRRKWAIFTIQKWVKGYLTRKRFRLMKLDVKYVRKLRRMMSVAIQKYQGKFIWQLIYQMNKAGQSYIKVQKDNLKKLRSYSALVIQRNWKGYLVRKYELPEAFQLKRISSKIIAFIRGWKVRKIMQ